MSTFAERVALGAAFLDEHDPDWWKADAGRAIDLGTLDLHDSRLCVLGQRCPLETVAAWNEAEDWENEPFHAQAQELNGHGDWLRLWPWSIECGFNLDYGYDGGFAELTAEWRRVITERRSAS